MKAAIKYIPFQEKLNNCKILQTKSQINAVKKKIKKNSGIHFIKSFHKKEISKISFASNASPISICNFSIPFMLLLFRTILNSCNFPENEESY